VAEQGGTGEFRRERALEALAILSINDEYFLGSLRDNLESTLWDYGFALSPDEMQAVRKYLGDHAQESDQQIINLLETLERRRW
jgi:hypothetical protein